MTCGSQHPHDFFHSSRPVHIHRVLPALCLRPPYCARDDDDGIVVVVESGVGLRSGARGPKLLDRVRTAIRARHYSRRTEDAYVHWMRRFIVFHGRAHPSTLGAREISAFLEWLAVEQRLSASTQNQALAAVLFLYRDVLRMDVGPVEAAIPRARTPTRVPTVLSVDEVRRVLAEMAGVPKLVASLLYGAGLRLQEALELRVKDIDFDRHEITVRRGKGQKDRRVMLPEMLRAALQRQLEAVRRLHEEDGSRGFGRVVLPEALDRKFPNAATEWRWQFVFPAGRICRDERFGPPTRYHLHDSVIQRAVADAARRAGIAKRVGCHTFRHHADCRIMPMTRWLSSIWPSFNRGERVGPLVNAA